MIPTWVLFLRRLRKQSINKVKLYRFQIQNIFKYLLLKALQLNEFWKVQDNFNQTVGYFHLILIVENPELSSVGRFFKVSICLIEIFHTLHSITTKKVFTKNIFGKNLHFLPLEKVLFVNFQLHAFCIIVTSETSISIKNAKTVSFWIWLNQNVAFESYFNYFPINFGFFYSLLFMSGLPSCCLRWHYDNNLYQQI